MPGRWGGQLPATSDLSRPRWGRPCSGVPVAVLLTAPLGGLAWRAVGVQGAAVDWAGGGDGAVGEQHDAPAPPVHGDEVVKGTQKEQVGQAGGAALGPWQDVVRVAGGRGLGAAREATVPVAGDDQAAQVGGD